ncbi:MAG: 6-phosphofructokinase [archaeon]
MKIGILAGAGDAPGEEAAVKSVRDHAQAEEVFGFMHGFRGLLRDQYRIITSAPFDEWRGGCQLGVDRFSPFHTSKDEKGKDIIPTDPTAQQELSEVVQAMAHTLIRHEIEGLVVMGNGKTLADANYLSDRLKNYGYRGGVVGLPVNIDNDINTGTHDGTLMSCLSIGYVSAAQYIVDCISNLTDCMNATGRIMVFETMGADNGWLAASAALCADVIYIPEVEVRPPVLQRGVSRTVHLFNEKRRNNNLNGVAVVCSEGIFYEDGGQLQQSSLDDVASDRKLSGAAKWLAGKTYELANKEVMRPKGNIRDGEHSLPEHLERRLNTEVYQVRPDQLDYLPRGTPVYYDVVSGRVLGEAAARMLRQPGSWGNAAVWKRILPVDQLSLDNVNMDMPLGKLTIMNFPVEYLSRTDPDQQRDIREVYLFQMVQKWKDILHTLGIRTGRLSELNRSEAYQG